MIMAPAPFFLFTSAFDPERPLLRPECGYGRYVLCGFTARREAYPPGIESFDQRSLQIVVQTLIASWHPALRRLIAESDPESFMFIEYMVARQPPAWPSTCVTLIGDAIHNMPPVGGMGGNTGLRDAYLLARQLITETSVRSAIAAYESEMREYGFQAVNIAMQSQAQGLVSRPMLVAGQKLWFAAGRLSPALMLKNLPYAEWAQPRAWEQSPAPWTTKSSRESGGRSSLISPMAARYTIGAGACQVKNWKKAPQATSAESGPRRPE
jgi:hypothetical protein